MKINPITLKSIENMKNKYKINDLEVEYETIHRNVKYPRLEIKTGYLYLILPNGYDNPEQLIKKHESWIYRKVSHIINSRKQAENRNLDMKCSDEELKDLILSYVKSISQELDVEVNKVRFRRMKSRWGSCSSQGNLNFNRYLKYLPSQLIEYIVFHEVAHLLEMGHNKKFWSIISTRFPNYKKMEDELLIYWLSVKDLEGIE